MNLPPNAPPAAGTAGASPWPDRGRRFAAAAVRAFHAYASWLVSISWKRFWLIAILGFIAIGILTELPPFTWEFTHQVEEPVVRKPVKSLPGVVVERPAGKGSVDGVEITIDERGVRVVPRREGAASAAVPAAPASAASAAAPSPPAAGVTIQLPPGASERVREAVEQARRDVEEAIRDADEEVRAAAEDEPATRMVRRVTRYSIADGIRQFVFVWILASIIIKITYKGRLQAEAKAAQATETAEAEALKRQVIEARMAAMQAQVEPHFLFNSLASIDHLIEVDPKRASQMQKNLIALLRASMPTLREAGGQGGNGGLRDLGRELAVIRPYLEILKVRMEERLSTAIDVPDGLLSAEFPPMMLQTLVENAIKHGLEPKPEGGELKVRAEVVHGRLAVSVIDTGLGFGKAATAGTGVGLANVRERLQLLYGGKGTLTVAENPSGGTIVTITVPYKPVEAAPGA